MSAWNPMLEPAVTAIVEVDAAAEAAPTLHLMSLDLTSVTGELVLVFLLMPAYSAPTDPALMNLKKRSSW